MTLTEYLGQPISAILSTTPFSTWAMEREVSDDSDECIVRYLFPDHSMEVRCDQNDRVLTIFLDAEHKSFADDRLCEVGREWTRAQVLTHFGRPDKSGPRVSHSVLGSYGEWDRFAFHGYAIHIEYALMGPGVRRITMMASSVVPE
jgi:hypothetical protein